MVTSSIIKYLLCDDISLENYYSGRMPTSNDIKRRLFLLDRKSDPDIPDHYYLLNKEYSFEGIGTITEILTKGLYQIADKYLELREKRVYVKQNMQNQWQELITYIPPLVLISCFLATRIRVDMKSKKDVMAFYHDYIVPNTRYTALPHPYLPQLEMYIKENKGFHDLHMHLNNATETDVTWQDYLFDPGKVYDDLQKGYGGELVKEQYEQESHFLNPITYTELLKIAQRLRSFFFNTLFLSELKCVSASCLKIKPILSCFKSTDECEFISNSIYHPFYWRIYNDTDKSEYKRRNLLSVEALMYVYLFNELTYSSNEMLGAMFHYYLLILGVTNRLLVQQTHQYGFVQFKKITVNELREQSEQAYYNRFFQLQGNDMRNILFLGGRFAPKDTFEKLEMLLMNIQKGWESMEKHIESEWLLAKECQMASDVLTVPQLKLIAHFIKAADTNPDKFVRYKTLRYKIWNQALILAFLKKSNSPYMKNVVAVDAASSEFDTPPEVFAPVFRMLRRSGFKHFTYHAGEDFYHILCGLRAIYEAVEFNDLRTGDRIGHATASGISPKLWKENIGGRILMKKGEYMDDLLFVYHLIINQTSNDSTLESLKMKIPFLANRIQEYSNEIYGKYYSLKSLEDAWMLRRFCPMLLSTITLSESDAWKKYTDENPMKISERLSVFDFEEWCDIRNELQGHYIDNESVEMFKKYHATVYRKKYDEIMEVEIEDCISLQELEDLQLTVLEYLHDKEIVIETLPTSNVRIGHHASFATYHLWNWIKWEEDGHSIPPIVVGTDDAGIFATNIFNEFANIYCFLTNIKKVSHNKAMEIISKLERNARVYKFLG